MGPRRRPRLRLLTRLKRSFEPTGKSGETRMMPPLPRRGGTTMARGPRSIRSLFVAALCLSASRAPSSGHDNDRYDETARRQRERRREQVAVVPTAGFCPACGQRLDRKLLLSPLGRDRKIKPTTTDARNSPGGVPNGPRPDGSFVWTVTCHTALD
jgi:hypothetical protein